MSAEKKTGIKGRPGVKKDREPKPKTGQFQKKKLTGTCPLCGKPAEEGSKVCPACGAPIDPGATRQV